MAASSITPKARIFLVDDESSARVLLTKLLQSKYEILVVGNAEDAQYEIPDFNPDVIVLDIIMPDINGYELAEWLRRDVRFSHLPIIFLSGLPKSTQLEDVGRVSGFAYLEKPIHGASLCAAIEDALAQLRSGGRSKANQ